MPGVIPSLFEVLREAREDADRDWQDIGSDLPWVHSDRTIGRWEKGSSFPAGKRIDEAVKIYVAKTGISEEAAWIKALIRAGLIAPPKGSDDQVSDLAAHLRRGELTLPERREGSQKK